MAAMAAFDEQMPCVGIFGTIVKNVCFLAFVSKS